MTDETQLIGNQKQFKTVEQCVLDNIPTLIYGPPGTGKTFTAEIISKKHRYKLVEYNTSNERKKDDIESIRKEVVTPSLIKKIYLFDEFDGVDTYGAYSSFLDIIKSSFYPIILTANDLGSIPKSIKNQIDKNARIVRYYPPKKRELMDSIEKMVGKVEDYDYSNITGDVRNSIISVTTGSETYEQSENIFGIVKNLFKGEGIEKKDFDNYTWIWLLDNLTRFYSSLDLFKAINVLADSSLVFKPEILNSMPVSRSNKNPTFPYYFRRVSAYKQSK